MRLLVVGWLVGWLHVATFDLGLMGNPFTPGAADDIRRSQELSGQWNGMVDRYLWLQNIPSTNSDPNAWMEEKLSASYNFGIVIRIISAYIL